MNFKEIFLFKQTNRPTWVPLVFSFLVAVSLFTGYAIGNVRYGMTASMGVWAFLYFSGNPSLQNFKSGFGVSLFFIACFLLGLAASIHKDLVVWVVFMVAFLSTFLIKKMRLGPPGSLFLVMASCIAMYKPIKSSEAILFQVLSFSFGILLSAIGYYLAHQAFRKNAKNSRQTSSSVNDESSQLVEALVVSLTLAISMLLAQFFEISRPYWAPITALAIVQSQSIKLMWTRNIQRVLGTITGLALTWIVLALDLDMLNVCLMLVLLNFGVEYFVVRNYGLASALITIQTVLLVELASSNAYEPLQIIQARFADTLIGLFWGLLGGWLLHRLIFRSHVKTSET